MQKRSKSAIALACLTSLTGCGYNFAQNPDANPTTIPPYWAQRDYVDPKIIGPLNTSIDFLAGKIAYKGGDGKYYFSGTPVFKGLPDIKVNAVQSAFNYHAVVNNGFTLTGQLPLLSATANANSAYDYLITDVANVIVPSGNIPDRATVAASPGLPAGVPLWYVAAVGLSTVKINNAVSKSTGDTIAGSGFSIGGTAYDASTESEYSPMFSISTVPMNSQADAVIAALPPPPPPPTPAAARGKPTAPLAPAAVPAHPHPPTFGVHLDHPEGALIPTAQSK